MDHSHHRVSLAKRSVIQLNDHRHVCEHILSSVARIARDSETAVAGPQDLYTALCEDESVWGFFKRMKGEPFIVQKLSNHVLQSKINLN